MEMASHPDEDYDIYAEKVEYVDSMKYYYGCLPPELGGQNFLLTNFQYA